MRDKRVVAILLSLFLFHAVCNYFWIKKDYFSFSPEKFTTLSFEHELYLRLQKRTDNLKDFLNKCKGIIEFTFEARRSQFKIIPLYTAVFNYCFGENINNAVLSNLPFLLLAMLFVFLLGRDLFSREAGLLASFIISFYPSFFGASRGYGVDFAEIAIVAMAFYFLVKAANSATMKDLTTFIVMFSAAVLVTPRAAVFLIGPLFYLIYKVIQKKSSMHILKIMVVFAFPLIITSPWWFPRKYLWWCLAPKMYILRLSNFLKLPLADTFSYVVRNYFIRAIGHISLLFTLTFVAALPFFAMRKMCCKGILTIFLLTPCFILPFFVNNFNRYFFPLFIGFALVTAVWLAGIKRRALKYTSIFLIILLSTLQFFDLSFGSHFLPYPLRKANKAVEDSIPEYEDWARPPDFYDEGIAAQRFFDDVYAYKEGNLQDTRVLLTGRCFDIKRGVFEYVFFVRSDRDMIKSLSICSAPGYEDYDFLIVMTYRPQSDVDCDIPDVEFFKWFDCRKQSILYRYCPGPLHFSASKREQMYEFFKRAPVLDYHIGGKYAYYLCINPKMKSKKGASR